MLQHPSTSAVVEQTAAQQLLLTRCLCLSVNQEQVLLLLTC
jgi:hypothetical protein